MTDQKITPCLWFDFNAEEAVAHYLAIFKSGRIVSTVCYGETGPGPVGAVMTILFEIEGQGFSRSTAARNSCSPPQSRSSSIARPRLRSTSFGTGSAKAASRANADG